MSSTSQLWQSFGLAIPYFLALILGIVLALVRWQRHPAVSATLIAALGAMLFTSIGYRVAFPLIVSGRGTAPISSVAYYLGLIGILIAVVRTISWAAVIAAVFGWRTAPDRQGSGPLQFSIRGLIAVTFVVALLCGFGRIFVGLLGDASPALIQIVDDLPVVVCLGIGSWIAAARWSRHPQVSLLAILAFLLAIAVSLIPQLIAFAVIQKSAGSPAAMALLNFITLLASSLSWILALIAALGWRSQAHQTKMPLAQSPLQY